MRRWLSVLVLLASVGAARKAYAEDTPRVKGVPSIPLLGVRDAAAAGLRFTLDRAPPASKEFNFDVPFSGTGPATGKLEVWPRAESKGTGNVRCSDGPNEHARQRYELGMSAVKDGDDRYLRAAVPPLQVDQPFCFKVEITATFGEKEMDDIAADAGNRLMAWIDANTTKSCPDIPESVFADALRTALQSAGAGVDVKNAAGRSYRYFIANLLDKCGEVRKAQNLIAPTLVVQAGDERDSKRVDITKLIDLPSTPSPRVLASGKKDLAAAWISSTDAATVKEVSVNLRTRAKPPYSAPDAAILLKWADRFLDLATALASGDAKKVEPARKALSDLKANGGRLSDGELIDDVATGAFVPSHFAKSLHAGEPTPSVMLDDLSDFGSHADKDQAKVGQWRTAYQALDAATKHLNDVAALQTAALTALKTARAALLAALPAVFSNEPSRQSILISSRTLIVSGTPGDGSTPQTANYAAVDAGAAVAIPSGGTKVDPWVVPYLGLNLYLAAVDRNVKLDELTGNNLMWLRQRLSLTVGFTLTDPSIAGRTIKGPFLDRYPLAALGGRFTQYTRVVAGAIFYELADANPASVHKKLGVAPFLGISLDIDVIHLLTSARASL